MSSTKLNLKSYETTQLPKTPNKPQLGSVFECEADLSEGEALTAFTLLAFDFKATKVEGRLTLTRSIVSHGAVSQPEFNEVKKKRK